MDKEREDILKEIRCGGGFNSKVFWQRAKRKRGKESTALMHSDGGIVEDEAQVGELAKSYFESLGA